MINRRLQPVALFLLLHSFIPAATISDLYQTPLLKGDKNQVQLGFQVETAIKPASITVQIKGHEQVATQANLDTGLTTISLSIPAVTGPTTCTVSVTPSRSAAPPETRDFLLQPVRRWKIFAVPSTHLDIGYTANRQSIINLHNDNLDAAMQLIAGNPAIKWNAEVAWEVQNYLQSRPETSATALLHTMKRETVGLHAGYLNMLTALMSDEAMNRYCLYAAHLGRTHDIHTSTAILSDVPTATWALPSVLAGSGIKYFSEGCNPDRGPMLPNSNLDNPFYWQGPDGKSVLTFFSRHYALSALWLAESPDQAHFNEGVVRTVAPFNRPDYPSDAVYLYGAFLDNRPFNSNYGRFLADYKAQWDSPEIIISTSDEFFEYLEKNSGSRLETRRGDYGAFWEDGAGSTAQATAIHIDNQRRVVTAETLYSLARLAQPDLEYPRDRLEKVWEDIMFYNEHTWGAAESISHPDSPAAIEQWTEKSEFAHRPHQQLDELTTKSLGLFVANAAPDTVTVVNPLGFARGGYVPVPQCPPGCQLQLQSTDGTPLPAQAIDGTLQAWADEIPAFGQRTYKITNSTTGPISSGIASATGLVNEHYKITAEAGVGITGITDIASGRQLLDPNSPYRFGQVVYALGGEDTSMVHSSSGNKPLFVHQQPLLGTHTATTPPLHQVHVYPAGGITVRPGNNGPLHLELIVSSSAPSMPTIETAIRLHNLEKRISVEVRITSKTEERRKEGVYVAFPFAADGQADFRLGMTNAVSDPATDFNTFGCHEWYCVQDFVTCRPPGGPEILWSSQDAPLVTLSELNRGSWKHSPELTTATIFSYPMNNYWHTNYKAGQGGDFLFRYSLTTSATGFNNLQRLQFSRAAANPLLAAPSPVNSTGGGRQAEISAPIKVSGDGVIVNTLRRSSTGSGYVLRLRNSGPEVAEATISAGATTRYKLLDLVENEFSPPSPWVENPATIQVPAFNTVTVYVE